MKKLVLSIITAATVAFSGCGTDLPLVQPVAPAQGQATAITQVEYMARPGIGEALLFSNTLLNTYNAVSPRFVAAALADSTSAEGQAAAPIFAQATAVLNILTTLNAGGIDTATAIAAFLPDVMRIDTSLGNAGSASDFQPADNVERASYPTFNQAGNMLVGGRKLTDDVVDITLATLTNGAIPGDGVPYYRSAGITNEAVGHSNLNGQAQPFGNATFPYLAPPQ